MTRFFMDDKDVKMIEQMAKAVDLVNSIIVDLSLDYDYMSSENEIMRSMESALHELDIGTKLFTAERLMLRPEKT